MQACMSSQITWTQISSSCLSKCTLLSQHAEQCDALRYHSKTCSLICRLSWEQEEAYLEAFQAIDRQIYLSLTR